MYCYDGAEVRREASSDGSWFNYVNGDEMDDHLWQTRSTGAASAVNDYYLTDHQGSLRGLVDYNGAVSSTSSYDTFGTRTGSAATRFGYTGREHDPDTGLMYYRARWYDSASGRFISEDPIGLAGGINLYGYVGNDPFNSVDPSGLRSRKKQVRPQVSPTTLPATAAEPSCATAPPPALTVHVWYPTTGHPGGHASMTLSDGTHISWWPIRSGKKDWATDWGVPGEPREFFEDFNLQGNRLPNAEVTIRGLDEGKIKNWWSEFQKRGYWSSVSRSCTAVVAQGLLYGMTSDEDRYKVVLDDPTSKPRWPVDLQRYAEFVKEVIEKKK